MSSMMRPNSLGEPRHHRPIVRMAGYTIIELLVVMVVLAVLASAAMPLVELSVKREKERELRHALWQIRDAIDSYHRAYERGRIANRPDLSGYPATLDTLVKGVEDAKQDNTTMYFLRNVPRDPFFGADVKPAQSWGLRSYASSAEKPASGDDVYDVYSKADGTGTNNVPYRQW
jgi:general secretion pathway protein G